MPSSEPISSKLQWSILSSKGEKLSFDLPRISRSFEEFMFVDIVTGDSDPVYWAIARAKGDIAFGPQWATRFCVAMLAYYHTGVAFQAAEISNGDEFWNYLTEGFAKFPRGSERRHFRGANGAVALATMRNWAPDPHDFFTKFTSDRTDYWMIRNKCEKHLIQFGPYFQLKVCDYMDRCLDLPIASFAGLNKNLPTEPSRALEVMFPGVHPTDSFLTLCKRIDSACIVAAPDFKRAAGPAEVETSLCGWKTTKFSGNWMGADIADKRAALTGFLPGNHRAEMFASMMPPHVPKGTFTLGDF